MQDLRTGEMKHLDKKFFEGFKELPPFEQREKLQAACDKAQPDRALQGPVFEVGEVIEIRGGRFQVTKIDLSGLKLKSLPARS